MSLPRPRARTSPARRAARPAPVLRVSGMLDQTVYDALFDAVMQGRLKVGSPGTELEFAL